MYTGRIHTKGATREKHATPTPEAQAKVNERRAEDVLRWRLNANFIHGDLHAVLHYYDKQVTLEQAETDKKEFLRLLRKHAESKGIAWKYIAVTETKRMTNIHHHIMLPKMPIHDVSLVWDAVITKQSGNVTFCPLDRRNNHAKLANYLIKESRSTTKRYKEQGIRSKRYTCSKGLIIPEPVYTTVKADTWIQEPRPTKGYELEKDENGNTYRTGTDEVTGYQWQEYTEIWVGDKPQPKATPRKPRKKKRKRK